MSIACTGMTLSSDARMNRIPPKRTPQHRCAGAFSLKVNCRGQMHQVVIPLPELPDPVDTRIPRRLQRDPVSDHLGAGQQQRNMSVYQ